MKLLRYGPDGAEKPGMLDSDGAIRDLSGLVSDIAGEAITPEGLNKLGAVEPASLPKVDGNPRLVLVIDRLAHEPKEPGVLLSEIVEVCPVCVIVCVSADQVEGFLTIIY